MRVVVCDADLLMRDLVEAAVVEAGHEVVGAADTNVDGVGLVEASRPDALVVDLSLDFNSDFDVIESAMTAGAKVVIFSRNADHRLLARYPQRPTVVPKPDLPELERVLRHLPLDGEQPATEERRRRPARAATGPPPTSLEDAQAFFTAVNEAEPGDALVSLDLPDDGASPIDVSLQLRDGDRVLTIAGGVRVYLPGGGGDGVTSFLHRVTSAALMPRDSQVASVVVGEGESGADAFDRLKHATTPRALIELERAD